MKNLLEELKNIWYEMDASSDVSENDIILFQKKHNLLIPNDLKEFFLTVNGTKQEYDKNFFRFFSFLEFRSIDDALIHKNGIPNYSNISHTFQNSSTCFVFADFEFHLFTYAIQLYKNENSYNEIYVLCGDEFEKKASSFAEFLDIYLNDINRLIL